MLTPREREVLALVAAGQSDKEIGGELSIGSKTVSNYVSRLLRKGRCGNRTELARWALDHRLAE
jgi:DNA-binding NarL/FixJ family response regulator